MVEEDAASSEHEVDIAMFEDSIDYYWVFARTNFEQEGRGAMVVPLEKLAAELDTRYWNSKQLNKLGQSEIDEAVGKYNPDSEFVGITVRPTREFYSLNVYIMPGP